MVTPAESVALSQEHFMRPDSYAPIRVGVDGRIAIECIDPRKVKPTGYDWRLTSKQTGGAGGGLSMDASIVSTSSEGVLVTPEEALKQEKVARFTTILTGHGGPCKFIAGFGVVLVEMITPSDITFARLQHAAQRLGVEDIITDRRQEQIRGAAGLVLDYVEQKESMGHLLGLIDDLEPERENAFDMVGENVSRVYVQNFHPHLGQDRNRKSHNLEPHLQAYHDSVAGMAHDILDVRGLSGQERALRLQAMLLRSAATETVLTRDYMDEMTFIEVVPTDEPKGIIVQEREW